MPRRKFFSLKEAVAMIVDDDTVTEADIVVLPPSTVDDQSDCEAIDENDLAAGDMFPNDVAGLIEVQYEVDKQSSDHRIKGGKRKRKLCAESQEPARKSRRIRIKKHQVFNDNDGSVRQGQKLLAMDNKVSTESGYEDPDLEQDDAEEAVEPQIVSNVKMKATKTKSKTPSVKWTKQKPRYSSQPVDNEKHDVSQLVQRLIAKSESQLFQEFFDDQLLEYISDQSKIYATQQIVMDLT